MYAEPELNLYRVILCSDDDGTICADCTRNTEIITLCSVVGGEFRHLRPRARVVGRALHEEIRGTSTCTSGSTLVVTVCSDDDGTVADSRMTEIIMLCSVVGA